MKKLSIVALTLITGSIGLLAHSIKQTDEERITSYTSIIESNDRDLKAIEKLSDLVIESIKTHANPEIASNIIETIGTNKMDIINTKQRVQNFRDVAITNINHLSYKLNDYKNDKFGFYDEKTCNEQIPLLTNRIQIEHEFVKKLDLQFNQIIQIEEKFEKETYEFLTKNLESSDQEIQNNFSSGKILQ